MNHISCLNKDRLGPDYKELFHGTDDQELYPVYDHIQRYECTMIHICDKHITNLKGGNITGSHCWQCM